MNDSIKIVVQCSKGFDVSDLCFDLDFLAGTGDDVEHRELVAQRLGWQRSSEPPLASGEEVFQLLDTAFGQNEARQP
ncbi:MAG: hypothetical protein COB10_12120 [Planctomycetota bacterium]|nr:MAG: hypothetical protein COB10_12120 [Planctomycetota bacterium]